MSETSGCCTWRKKITGYMAAAVSFSLYEKSRKVRHFLCLSLYQFSWSAVKTDPPEDRQKLQQSRYSVMTRQRQTWCFFTIILNTCFRPNKPKIVLTCGAFLVVNLQLNAPVWILYESRMNVVWMLTPIYLCKTQIKSLTSSSSSNWSLDHFWATLNC